MGIFDSLKNKIMPSKNHIMMEISGLMNLHYFQDREGAPAFVSGEYSGKGVTIDQLNTRGDADAWHEHGRIIVSIDQVRKEYHAITKKGTFLSQGLIGVPIDHEKFSEEYVVLSSNPSRVKQFFTPEAAGWIVKLKMPFTIQKGRMLFHQAGAFKDKERVRHIVDALIYIGNKFEQSR